jgi:hypothetical protein
MAGLHQHETAATERAHQLPANTALAAQAWQRSLYLSLYVVCRYPWLGPRPAIPGLHAYPWAYPGGARAWLHQPWRGHEERGVAHAACRGDHLIRAQQAQERQQRHNVYGRYVGCTQRERKTNIKACSTSHHP